MRVKELIEALQEFDPEAVVIASIDDEGNDFHLVEPYSALLDRQIYTNTWADGTIHRWYEYEPVNEQDVKDGEYGEDVEVEDFRPGVCFWPASEKVLEGQEDEN